MCFAATRSYVFVCSMVVVMTVGNAPPVAGQSGSNASNYNHGAQLQVNGRTGDVTISMDLVRLPGVVSELGLSLAISYRSEDARSAIQGNMRHFGLPYGWSLGLSFLYNEGSAIKLNVDGTSVYQLDDNWRTAFVPTGSDVPLLAKTGLRQYSRADANLKTDQGSVTVNGLGSAYVFSNLEGQSKFFSAGGLLIREEDRFGNYIDYHYLNSVTGGNASNSTTAANAELSEMVDTWGHTVTIGPCLDPESCVANETRITMPDGRTVGWVAPDAYTIEQIIDTEGMVTHLEWENSTCGDQSYGNRRLASMTTSSGGMTALDYTCLPVCLQPSATECVQTTSWSVVSEQFQCPNNQSGTSCPAGSPNGDHLTTRYTYGTTEDIRNYTGYPRYSPFEPSVAGADALMSAPDAGSFQYTTVTSKHRVTGEAIHQVENDYNFLHLEQEQRIYVSDGSSQTLRLSKESSHCYPISDTEPTTGCPLTSANYQSLPSNYQSAIISGSCQYNTDSAGGGTARRSVVTMTHDAFGNVIRKRIYHATGEQGVVTSCDRAVRLSTSGMRMVVEDHMQHDTPTSLGSDGYVELGVGSGQFGLMLGQQSFVFLDEDDSGVGAHRALQETTGPVLVKLQCHQLTAGGTAGEAAGVNIKTSTVGLMDRAASAPTQLGIIDACPQPGDGGGAGVGSSWIASPAPPKTTTFSYDESGRSLEQVTAWASGYTAPGGVSSTNQSFEYSMTAATEDEEACPGGESVLQVVSTDTEGHSTTNRLCTLNGFHLSAADPNGNTTYMEHSPNGLVTKTTHADGTYVEIEHYYACPVAQDGRTDTCPSGSTVLKSCPHDDAEQKRNCIAKTVSSADGQSSFVDGVTHVMIRDGLGRVVEELDDLGGSVGAGFTAMQKRSTKTYDDRGMLTGSSVRQGATDALVYETKITLGPKLRPLLVCGPRRETHQFIHDDVNQKTMTVFNGSDREGYVVNDSHKLTTIANCDLVADQTTSGDEECPTVAVDTSTADCEGDGYFTYTLHDGAGQEHSLVAMAGGEVDLGASVTGVNGVATYSADMLKYAYELSSDNQSADDIAANSSFVRDLQGHVLEHVVTVEKTDNAQPTPVTTTSVFSSDRYEFNGISQKIRETNKLSDLEGAPSLDETYTYDDVGNLQTVTTYAGVTFENYYDERNRLVRHCFPTASGSEGEKMDLDPVTGAILVVTRFTNPGSCSEDDSGDVDVVSESYTYTRFGAVESITYGDGTRLEWGYDPYQRVVCMADALATQNGNGCPESPIASGFAPDPSELLVWHEYWEDDDPYRRGFAKKKCRGVPDGNGGFVTKCMETDYYTSVDAGGSCSEGLAEIVGAYGGLVKTETYCTGGSCEDGADEVYQTTYRYDEHRRPCSVESINGSGAIMLSSAYEYDQFDNVVHEEHRSDLDASDDSNYQLDYVYDGLLRLVQETRSDLSGDLIKKTTFEYDAASNLVRKTEEEPDFGVTPPTPRETPTAGETPTETEETPTAPPATPTGSPASTSTAAPPATATPPTQGRADDDSCQVVRPVSGSWSLVALLLGPIVLVVARRVGQWRGRP